jgi:hypothetical protein
MGQSNISFGYVLCSRILRKAETEGCRKMGRLKKALKRIYTGIRTDSALEAFLFSTYCIGSDCGVLQPVTFITNDKIKLNLRDVIIITNKHFI